MFLFFNAINFFLLVMRRALLCRKETMHGSLYFLAFTSFLLSSCAPSSLSCAPPATLSRRFLYDAALPPPETPSSTSTPGGSPFFPLYTSVPPPPPPPPATFATFPANISALVLPRSPKPQPGSRKLLVPAISAVLSAATVIGVAFFLYGRWREQNGYFKDEDKSSTPNSSHELRALPRNTTNSNKLSVTGTSSEVLYLGNVVSSRSVENQGCNEICEPGSSFSKPESPEIRPLPPLPVRSCEENYEAADSLTEDEEGEEEEEDEFYSPLASLAGTEGSTRPGYGFGSGHGLACQEPGARIVAYSTCSCSSSSSGSPARSLSITISPPMSSTVPQRDSDASSEQNPRSPSPERRVRNHNRGGSLRAFSFWNHGVGFPRISSASTSPDRGTIRTPDAYARSSMYSSVSTSPDGVFRKFTEGSPPKWNDFNRNVQSVLLSSNSASPRRDFVINLHESSGNLDPSVENPEFCRTEQSESAPPPHRPPPPPPAPPTQQPLPSQRIPEPPPLVPPSQPFVVHKPGKKLSFSELPSSSEATEQPKPKLKPLHWDKVRASSYRKTAWDRLRSSSFKLNEEMIETLFVAKPSRLNSKQRSLSCDIPMLNQDYRIIDPKKAQNIAILLRALNLTTNDVCQALLYGDSDALGIELLESLSRMSPNQEEERKLKEHKDDSSIKLGLAEKFLKEVLDVPFGFRRVDALLYMAKFDSEVEYLKRSFDAIQAACEELQNSRMFLKLLEAVLKTGNKMNDGTNRGDAQAFKLDTLLTLVDVKGTDGRTTLLHFVVQEIIKSEGARLFDTVKSSDSPVNQEEEAHCKKLGLQVIGNLSSELSDVKKSADMDYSILKSDVSKLSHGINTISEVLRLSEEIGSNEDQWRKFNESMTQFLETAKVEIKKIETQESAMLSAVKDITEYFHGDSAKEEAHPFRIFVVVRDFLAILDRVCKEIRVPREQTTYSFTHRFHP